MEILDDDMSITSKLAKTFYPSEFDADTWVKAIKAAGAKYITITTRHHDGFSLFKTLPARIIPLMVLLSNVTS